MLNLQNYIIKQKLAKYDQKIKLCAEILKISKKIIKSYVEDVLDNINLSTVKLKDICDFLPESHNQKEAYGYYFGNGPFLCSKPYPTFCIVPDYNDDTIIINKSIPLVSCYDQFSCTCEYFLLRSNNPNITNYWIYYNLIVDKNLLKIGFLTKDTEYISKSFIENLEIIVPSLEQQKKIEIIFDNLKLIKKNMITWASERNELYCALGLSKQSKKI